MAEQAKTEYAQLSVGFEFPPQSYQLDEPVVAAYLGATQDAQTLFRSEKLVPPMAVTAFAMAALAGVLSIPSGTIHVSQELDFLKLVHVGERITCLSKISRKVDRGGLRLMNTDITVLDQNQDRVLTGRVGFVLPGPGMAGGQK
jgi:acyl dehydratase